MAALKPFSGTFLSPGVSLNGRLYTPEMIGKAVARMRERIADPDGLPIVMRTHHQAADNSRLIVGRVIDAQQEKDGRGTYRARWYDTAPARDIAALVQPADGGPPGLRSVSIFGYFLGPERTVEVDGEQAVTADDLEVDAIDFTATPGVVKALIAASAPGAPAESAPPAAPGRTPISETWEVFVQDMTEQLPEPAPPGADAASGAQPPAAPDPEHAAVGEAYTAAQKRAMAAKGQAMVNDDGSISYPIKSKSDLRKAIRAVGRGGADHDKIRAHVIARAKALGLSSMIPDTWNADGSLKETSGRTRLGEIRECYDSYAGEPAAAGFAIDAFNGPLSITMRAPRIDPSDLRAIAAAAMTAACDALQALDPDMDADIDIPGAPDEDTDHDEPGQDDEPEDDIDTPPPGSGCPCGCHEMTGGPGCPCPCGDCEVCNSTGAPAAEAAQAPAPAAPQISTPPPAVPEPAPAPKESAVSETTVPAAEAATSETPVPAPVTAVPQVLSMTQEMLDSLLASAARAAVAAVTAATPTVETAPTAAVPVDAAPAPVAPVAEAAPAPGLTADAVALAVNSALKAQLPNILTAYGLPPRRGFRTAETDSGEKDLTPGQLWDKRADLLLGAGFGQ